jgi:branched-chain amino acid aminotransferase
MKSESDYIAYLNGQFVPYSECKIHVSDRGFLVGDVVFDTERTFNGKIFRLRDHLDRLYRSLKYIRIDPGLTIDQFESLAQEVVKRNEPWRNEVGDFWVSEFVTRGRGLKVSDWLGVTEKVPPTVGIRVHPIQFWRYAQYYETGVNVVIARTRTYSSDSVDPKIKHHSRINFALAELEVADVDLHAYPLLLDPYGNIAETAGGNFFIVSKGVLRTPSRKYVLEGISRMTVFELAQQLKIPAIEEDIQPYDAYTADEAFLTTTSYCALPVTQIDNRPLGKKAPGPVTKQILAAWSKFAGLDIVDQALQYDKKPS